MTFFPSTEPALPHPNLGSKIKVYLNNGMQALGVLREYRLDYWVLQNQESGALLEIFNPSTNIVMVQLLTDSVPEALEFKTPAPPVLAPGAIKAAVAKIVSGDPEERELAKKSLVDLQKAKFQNDREQLEYQLKKPLETQTSYYGTPNFQSFPQQAPRLNDSRIGKLLSMRR
jgi:hypothetical protein